MIILWGFFDRFLDMVGLISIVYWTVRAAKAWSWAHTATVFGAAAALTALIVYYHI